MKKYTDRLKQSIKDAFYTLNKVNSYGTLDIADYEVLYNAIDCICDNAAIVAVMGEDVVPWAWLEMYASGMRMNHASDWVRHARKEYDGG